MKTLHPTLLGLLLSGALHAQEVCNNALDDDNDGAIDLNDPDCGCFGSLNSDVPSLIPNHSFEERMCCPLGLVSPFSPPWLSCAQGWQAPTEGTTDYFNTCGYMPEPMVVQPAPDGDGFVGVYPGIHISDFNYFEYACRSLGLAPLEPGVAYTMEAWFAPTSSDNHFDSTAGNFYDGAVRMALFGRSEFAPLPISTLECLGAEPGWTELAVAELAPSTTWQRVRFNFTPQEQVVDIAVGGSCYQPSNVQSLLDTTIVGEDTTVLELEPYVLIDELVLNTSDQFQTGITSTGAWCTADVVLTAVLADGASEGQWYHNGIALIGETSATLNLSEAHDGGLYTFTQQGPEECIRHDVEVPMRPAFTATPENGPAPLEVTFITADGQNGIWDLGDGTQLEGDTIVHTYVTAGAFTVSLEQAVQGCATTTSVDSAVVVSEVGQYINGSLRPMDILLTPNPVQDVLHVRAPFVAEHWRMLNALGQLVQQGRGNGTSLVLDTRSLNAGTYVLVLEADDRNSKVRFVKD